jgi:hypothetical protein
MNAANPVFDGDEPSTPRPGCSFIRPGGGLEINPSVAAVLAEQPQLVEYAEKFEAAEIDARLRASSRQGSKEPSNPSRSSPRPTGLYGIPVQIIS